ncbi:MAG: bifunctional demethylmenaquinone methyltransferase/2-methoxy-6-polyprenyl-1,4-benzoquinol methylase UbiE [Peptococcaceae bacterium]|nr:bifunctional demethylmenaquinone methyltransferase/2-methoxy-6-polyprenyl-1,4-benzoquinol methylase UbiE [Peptococcaceae bacterium]
MDLTGKSKEKYVKETFNRISEKYDFMNRMMSFGLDRFWRKKVVKIVRAKTGMKILDVCCGTGMLTIELAKKVGSSGRVIGLDFSENMLEQARKNISVLPEKENITFIQGDALQLPFEDNSFDGATIGWGLRNLSSIKSGIQEMRRVVKPGSLVVSIDMGKPSWPIFKQLYWFAFEKVVPFLGKVGAGGKQEEYKYLYQSALVFESQQELAEIFANCGLQNTGYINLVGGAVSIVYGMK